MQGPASRDFLWFVFSNARNIQQQFLRPQGPFLHIREVGVEAPSLAVPAFQSKIKRK